MFPERVGRVILDGVLDATRVATLQSYKVRMVCGVDMPLKSRMLI